MEIRSSSNARFKRMLALASSARDRKQIALTLLEGEHLAQAWLEAGSGPVDEVVLPRRSKERSQLWALSQRLGRTVLLMDDALFDRLSQVAHGPGPLFTIPVPQRRIDAPLDGDAIYLDGLQDPGNAGTLLRSALAFGVRCVMASPDCVDLWSPKVLRAGMGAHFGLAIFEGLDPRQVIDLKGKSILTATLPQAAMQLPDADLRGPRVWLFGSEGGGLSPQFSGSGLCEGLRIPHQSGVESLNVAVAASICLFEQFRQRSR